MRNLACDAIVDQLDGGTIQIRTGAQPASPNDAASGTLLATLTFGTPAFGDSVSGTATANAISSDTSVDDTGTAGHARMLTSGAATAFVAGGTAAISSLTLTVPEQ